MKHSDGKQSFTLAFPAASHFCIKLRLACLPSSSLCSSRPYYTAALVQSHARMILKWPFFLSYRSVKRVVVSMVAKKVSLTLFCGCFILDCQRLMHFSCCLSERRRAQPTSRYLFTFFPALIGLGDGHSKHKLDLLLASFPSHPTRVVAKKKERDLFCSLVPTLRELSPNLYSWDRKPAVSVVGILHNYYD